VVVNLSILYSYTAWRRLAKAETTSC